MDNKIIKIYTIGLDSQLEIMIELVFEHKIKGFALSAQECHADAYLFDFDSVQAKDYWHSYRKHHPHTPAIILSLQDNVPERFFFVKKPVNLNEFVKVLDRLKHTIHKNQHIEIQNKIPPHTTHTSSKKEEMVLRVHSSQKTDDNNVGKSFEDRNIVTLASYAENTICGHQADIDPDDIKSMHLITYNRSTRLQGLIEKALEVAKHAECVNCLKGVMGELLIDPTNNRVLSSVKEQTLDSLMLMPSKNLQLESKLLSLHQAKEHVRSSTTPFYYDCMEHFLWKTALLTAHGRVPVGTNLQDPVVLLRWPNFSRLMLTPYALQITALWAESPYSLIETAKMLQIPQRYVFSLYSAMSALNLAWVASGVTPPKKTISLSAQPEKRNLFQRLLAKLAF